MKLLERRARLQRWASFGLVLLFVSCSTGFLSSVNPTDRELILGEVLNIGTVIGGVALFMRFPVTTEKSFTAIVDSVRAVRVELTLVDLAALLMSTSVHREIVKLVAANAAVPVFFILIVNAGLAVLIFGIAEVISHSGTFGARADGTSEVGE